MMRYGAVLLLGMAWALPAAAQTAGDEKILELENKINALQQEIDLLKQQGAAAPASGAEAASPQAAGETEAAPDPASQPAVLPEPVAMEVDPEKRRAELQNRYRICQYRYTPKEAGEPQAMIEISANKGSFGEREKLYRQYMAKYPGSPDLQTAYVQEMLGAHMLKEAHYYLSDALKRFPDDPKVRFLLDQYRYMLANEGADKDVLQRNLQKAFADYNEASLECVKTVPVTPANALPPAF